MWKVTKADKIWLFKNIFYILNYKIIIKYLNLIIIDIEIINKCFFLNCGSKLIDISYKYLFMLKWT